MRHERCFILPNQRDRWAQCTDRFGVVAFNRCCVSQLGVVEVIVRHGIDQRAGQDRDAEHLPAPTGARKGVSNEGTTRNRTTQKRQGSERSKDTGRTCSQGARTVGRGSTRSRQGQLAAPRAHLHPMVIHERISLLTPARLRRFDRPGHLALPHLERAGSRQADSQQTE